MKCKLMKYLQNKSELKISVIQTLVLQSYKTFKKKENMTVHEMAFNSWVQNHFCVFHEFRLVKLLKMYF